MNLQKPLCQHVFFLNMIWTRFCIVCENMLEDNKFHRWDKNWCQYFLIFG